MPKVNCPICGKFMRQVSITEAWDKLGRINKIANLHCRTCGWTTSEYIGGSLFEEPKTEQNISRGHIRNPKDIPK